MKFSQSAFLKFLNSLFLLFWGLMSVSRVTIMGRWSDPSEISVCQDAKGIRSRVARVISGDVSCQLDGRHVGMSSLITAKLEPVISSDNRLPLASCKLENQRGSWALKSPRTSVSLSFNKCLTLTV